MFASHSSEKRGSSKSPESIAHSASAEVGPTWTCSPGLRLIHVPCGKAGSSSVTGMPGTTIPPMMYEEADFPSDFNPSYKKQILDMVKAAKDNDFGFLAWCSWPQKTEAYMYTNLPNVWLGQTSAKDFLTETQKVFEADLKAGVVSVGPEPRK